MRNSLRTIAFFGLSSMLCGGLAADFHKKHAFPKTPPPRNDIRVENRVPVPMRDGVTLYSDVYLPVGAGKYPVLVSRTPYSTERYPSSYAAAVYFARRGYVFVYQDVRGRHEEEGKWEPFRDDIEDGYDTIEWAAKQPWSNGKVGMQGGSYLGHVQWRAAMSKPPSLVTFLVTIYPDVASTSLYHDWITLNGGWRLSFNFGWGAVRQESRIMQNTGPHTMAAGPENISYDKVLDHLPLNTMEPLVGRNAQFYKDWLAHPDYDEYWKKINVEEVFDEIEIPIHAQGGWFDIFSQGTLRGYVGVSKKGKTKRLRRADAPHHRSAEDDQGTRRVLGGLGTSHERGDGRPIGSRSLFGGAASSHEDAEISERVGSAAYPFSSCMLSLRSEVPLAMCRFSP